MWAVYISIGVIVGIILSIVLALRWFVRAYMDR